MEFINVKLQENFDKGDQILEKIPPVPKAFSKSRSRFSRLSSRKLSLIEEDQELPPDPKIRTFGSQYSD